MDVETFALAKAYTKATANGLGAVKGTPCTIAGTEEVENGIAITFQWTGNDGTTKQQVVTIPKGQQGNDGVSPNIKDISDLKTKVNDNEANITDLTDRIATNEKNISTNTSNITTNTNDISTIKDKVSTTETNISTLTTKVAINTANIVTNTAKIDEHDTKISNLENSVTTNTSSIATNKTSITTNATNIAANKTAIEKNTTDITDLKTRISVNEKNIGDVSTFALSSWTDLVTAVNYNYNKGLKSIAYKIADGKRYLTFTNNDTTETDYDITSLITDIKINELNDVNIDKLSLNDGQFLGYDYGTSTWKNITVDFQGLLSSTKKYTDEQILNAQKNQAYSVDVDTKPVYNTNTLSVTYIKNGETLTFDDSNTNNTPWFYYYENSKPVQTKWVQQIEYTIDVGSIDFSDYVNYQDVVSTYTGLNSEDKTKVPNIAALDALNALITTTLAIKVNTFDIVDNLISTETTKPLAANQGRILNKELNTKVNITDIVDTLDSDSTDKPLSANQGKILSDKIDTELAKKVNITDIVDTLDSDSTDKPLSANQGKALSDKIDTDLTAKLDIQQSINEAGKVAIIGKDGKITFTEAKGLSGAAENVSYENANYADYTNIKLAIDGILSRLDYVKPSITLFTSSPAGGTFEIGSKISEVTFNWTVNKDIVAQTLTDCKLADTTVRTATYSNEISSNKTFTLNVSDGTNSTTKSITFSFLNKVYYGSATLKDTYDSAFILGLSGRKFASNYKGTYSITVNADEYGFICFPSSFGTLKSAYIGGFETELVFVGDISFTNASGGITTYSMYRTGQANLGTISMEVK